VDAEGEENKQAIEDFDFDWSGVFVNPKYTKSQLPSTPERSLKNSFTNIAILFLAISSIVPNNSFYAVIAYCAGLLGLYLTLSTLYATINHN
jgi:hypothetical protein